MSLLAGELRYETSVIRNKICCTKVMNFLPCFDVSFFTLLSTPDETEIGWIILISNIVIRQKKRGKINELLVSTSQTHCFVIFSMNWMSSKFSSVQNCWSVCFDNYVFALFIISDAFCLMFQCSWKQNCALYSCEIVLWVNFSSC